MVYQIVKDVRWKDGNETENKSYIRKIIEMNIDSLDDLGVMLPGYMDDVNYLLDEGRSIETSLVSSEFISDD